MYKSPDATVSRAPKMARFKIGLPSFCPGASPPHPPPPPMAPEKA